MVLARRSPNHEIVHVAGDMPNKWQSALILFGMFGLASAAFLWGDSALYVTMRQFLADRLVDWGAIWPLEPWPPGMCSPIIPELNDTMTPLDGFVLLVYLLGVARRSAERPVSASPRRPGSAGPGRGPASTISRKG